MRYFLISDIHGCYTKAKQALDEAGFDKDKDTLVSLGDLFDRGTENTEVLEYIMSLPNRILIGGNHDYRLKKLFYQEASLDWADEWNGTEQTINEFTNHTLKFRKNGKITKLLEQLFKELHGAIEFKNYVCSHAWLVPSFRNYSKKQFESLSWEDSRFHWLCGVFPDKKLIIGHFHAVRFRYPNVGKDILEKAYDNPENHKIFEDEHIIAIDGCTPYEYGRSNVFVIEDDLENVKIYC